MVSELFLTFITRALSIGATAIKEIKGFVLVLRNRFDKPRPRRLLLSIERNNPSKIREKLI
jgi:hypothetical protein